MKIDVDILTETNLTGHHELEYEGYTIIASLSTSPQQGGIAIVAREKDRWGDIESRDHGLGEDLAHLRGILRFPACC